MNTGGDATESKTMKTLKPVDFKAVAAKGAFVYCYLRSKNSKTAKAGSPYYIGLSLIHI